MTDPIIIFDLVGRRIVIGREEIKEVSEGYRSIDERIRFVELYDGKCLLTDETLESLIQRINRYHPAM